MKRCKHEKISVTTLEAPGLQGCYSVKCLDCDQVSAPIPGHSVAVSGVYATPEDRIRAFVQQFGIPIGHTVYAHDEDPTPPPRILSPEAARRLLNVPKNKPDKMKGANSK